VEAFLALTAWLARSNRPGRWLDAWVTFSLIFVFQVMAIRFPWYMAWSIMIALTRRGPLGSILAAVSLACSFYLMQGYCRSP
jgi:hypothetical protein